MMMCRLVIAYMRSSPPQKAALQVSGDFTEFVYLLLSAISKTNFACTPHLEFRDLTNQGTNRACIKIIMHSDIVLNFSMIFFLHLQIKCESVTVFAYYSKN